MGGTLTAWVSYLSAVGILYSIGQKAEEFLSEKTIQHIRHFSKDQPVSNSLNALMLFISAALDKALKFRKDGLFYRPRLLRSVALSVIMFALVAYPLRDFPFILIMYFGLTTRMMFEGGLSNLSGLFSGSTGDMLFGLAFFGGTMTMFIGSNIISDFISFSKTRTVVAAVAIGISPLRLFLVGCFDLITSLIMAFSSSLAVCLLFTESVMAPQIIFGNYMPVIVKVALLSPILITIVATLFLVRKWSVVGTIIAAIAIFLGSTVLVWSIIEPVKSVSDFGKLLLSLLTSGFSFAVGAPVFSMATSLGVTVISIFVALVGLIESATSRLEAKGIWKPLNLERKPMQSSAVIAIIIFTVLYWPTVLLF